MWCPHTHTTKLRAKSQFFSISGSVTGKTFLEENYLRSKEAPARVQIAGWQPGLPELLVTVFPQKPNLKESQKPITSLSVFPPEGEPPDPLVLSSQPH